MVHFKMINTKIDMFLKIIDSIEDVEFFNYSKLGKFDKMFPSVDNFGEFFFTCLSLDMGYNEKENYHYYKHEGKEYNFKSDWNKEDKTVTITKINCVEFVEYNLRKNPTYKKFILNFNCNNIRLINESIKIIKDDKHKKVVNKVMLDSDLCNTIYNFNFNIHQRKTRLMRGYDNTKETSKIRKENPEFLSLNSVEKFTRIHTSKIDYKIDNNFNLILKPRTYEESSKITPGGWCTSRNKQTWEAYHKNSKNNQQTCYITSTNCIGFSVDKTAIKSFDKNNKEIGYKIIEEVMSFSPMLASVIKDEMQETNWTYETVISLSMLGLTFLSLSNFWYLFSPLLIAFLFLSYWLMGNETLNFGNNIFYSWTCSLIITIVMSSVLQNEMINNKYLNKLFSGSPIININSSEKLTINDIINNKITLDGLRDFEDKNKKVFKSLVNYDLTLKRVYHFDFKNDSKEIFYLILKNTDENVINKKNMIGNAILSNNIDFVEMIRKDPRFDLSIKNKEIYKMVKDKDTTIKTMAILQQDKSVYEYLKRYHPEKISELQYFKK